MATGTVIYSLTRRAGQDGVYTASQSGYFPDKYTVKKVSVGGSYTKGANISITICRLDGNSETTLGSVTFSDGGIRDSMSTGANYEGITAVRIYGPASRLHAEYAVRSIVVVWEDETVVREPEGFEEEEKESITGTTKTSPEARPAMSTDVIIRFEGVDISDEIKKYLITFSYTDKEEDETDDLQMTLQDVKGSWMKKWLDASLQAAISHGAITTGGANKGLKIEATIVQTLPGGKQRRGSCGTFTLDAIKESGPPSVVTIKATSLPYASGVRSDKRDKSWENYSLSGIGDEMAKKAGMGFVYDAHTDPTYKHVEQVHDTDIGFMQQLAHKDSLSLKVSDNKIIVYDQAKYEQQAPVTTIRWEDGSYTKYDLGTSEGDVTYARCEVRYFDPDTKRLITGSAQDENFDAEDENNQTLVISDQKVTTTAEANALAAKLLKLHNKFEREASFTLIGNPLLTAGLTMTLSGFGMWDGKYIIKECRHDVGGSGYTTRIKLRCVYAHTVEGGKSAEEKTESKKHSGSSSGGEKKETGGGSSSASGKSSSSGGYKTGYSATMFDNPDGTGGSGHLDAGTGVTIMGSTSGEYTLVKGPDGKMGYVKTSTLEKN